MRSEQCVGVSVCLPLVPARILNLKPAPPSALFISVDGHPDRLVSHVKSLGAIFDSAVYHTRQLLTDHRRLPLAWMTAADFCVVTLVPSMDPSPHSSSFSPNSLA